MVGAFTQKTAQTRTRRPTGRILARCLNATPGCTRYAGLHVSLLSQTVSRTNKGHKSTLIRLFVLVFILPILIVTKCRRGQDSETVMKISEEQRCNDDVFSKVNTCHNLSNPFSADVEDP